MANGEPAPPSFSRSLFLSRPLVLAQNKPYVTNIGPSMACTESGYMLLRCIPFYILYIQQVFFECMLVNQSNDRTNGAQNLLSPLPPSLSLSADQMMMRMRVLTW